MSKVYGSRIMSDYNMADKYVRYIPELSRRETYEEATRREMDMHRVKYSEHMEVLAPMIDRAERILLERKVLGSQRALQFGGEAILRKNLRIMNCAFSYVDRIEFFSEALWLLLCGTGVGLSIQKHHVAQLPDLRSNKTPYEEAAYIIQDTVEGWADSAHALASFWFGLTDRKPIFDGSLIRPKGAPLSTGGRAPGPDGLLKSLKQADRLFASLVEAGRKRVRPLDMADVVLILSEAVLSGGIRRSALIVLFSPSDKETLTCKTGNWWETAPWRARANFSMLLIRSNDADLEHFKIAMKAVREYGDPGFIFSNSTEMGYNPCVEAGLLPLYITKDDIPVENYSLDLIDFKNRKTHLANGYKFYVGWSFCNLDEINAAIIKGEDDFREAAWAAAFIGTLQAGYTDVGYLTDISRKIMEREALLGVSLTGVMDNKDIILNFPLLRRMAEYVVEVNKEIAAIIGINQASRCTVGKPAGNTTITFSNDRYLYSSGFNLQKTSGKMIRRIQVNKSSPIAQYFKAHNPHLVSESKHSRDKTDYSIAFPVEVMPGTLSTENTTPIEFLEMLKEAYRAWVLPGTGLPERSEGCFHNISNTCDVTDGKWSELGRYIWQNREHFAGIALLASSGAYVYHQAPMQPIIDKADLIDKFGDLNFSAARQIAEMLESIGLTIPDVAAPLISMATDMNAWRIQRDFGRHRLFWQMLFDQITRTLRVGSIHDALQLIASSFDEELWASLTADLKEVDYSKMIEESDNTTRAENLACASGVCEI